MRVRIGITILSLLVLCTKAQAAYNGWYIGGAASYLFQADSDNGGTTGSFATGNGSSSIPAGTQVSAGTPYDWETEFDDGWGLSGEIGKMFVDGWRLAVELNYTSADVDQHSGALLGGTDIGSQDAALLTGSTSQSGVSVSQLVADGRGDLSTLGVFLNGYFDFNKEGAFQPYLGVGLGFVMAEVEFKPSGVTIVDDDETKFGFQFRAGAAYSITEYTDIYGEYTYRITDDIEVENSLFPGDLEIENEQHLLSAGVRYRFTY
ncbi:outer membrane beta-barrel protein [Desulfosediminicola sp.]|uniref:outer membrane beta-barrel protein n=1 Tax=Desulfosediminicola sp. TaxID=2886825 RepID=UPI003AF285AF